LAFYFKGFPIQPRVNFWGGKILGNWIKGWVAYQGEGQVWLGGFLNQGIPLGKLTGNLKGRQFFPNKGINFKVLPYWKV